MRLGLTLATFRELGAQVAMHRQDSAVAARAAIADVAGKTDRLVVVGGDGMVHQAANALAGTDTVLGIVSAGTGNDAVKALGLSNDVEQACKDALADPMPIDLIQTDHGVAVTVATAGFSVSVNERADAMKRVRGATKYTASSLLELPRLRSHTMTLVLDGTPHEIDANLIAVANTAYFGGGMKIAPVADPTDGVLDVIVIGPASRAVFAAILPTVFSGNHVKTSYVTTYQAKVVELRNDQSSLRADGEIFGDLPAKFTVQSRSLSVAGAKVET